GQNYGSVERSRRKTDLQHPPSPCPSVFSYEGQEAEKDQWFGVILVTTEELLAGLRLDLRLDKPASLLGNWLGEVKSKDNIHFTILNLNQKVMPGPPLSIRIFVKFPQGQSVPRLRTIHINGRQICPADHGSTPNTQEPITTTRNSSLVTERRGSSITAPDYAGGQMECGRVAVQPAPLITHGQNTARGQFPWHAALYQSKDINLKYICGGSLIGPKTILTAAHCVTKSTVLQPVDPDSLLVYLGKYHLKQWSEGGVQDKQVVKILVHPAYNNSNYQSDLALLILSSPVKFTTNVRPVCLWDKKEADLENVVNKEGTVIGWGYDETGQITEELKMSKMPIVSQQVCLWSSSDFYPLFTSDKTYCAGFRNGSSVCNGDSGGGMVFPRNSSDGSVTWMLRGVVSISKPKGIHQPVCDPTNYVIFTDAAKYLDWIQNHIK
ncbi:serine protease gd-like, partial [Zootermopsis nevadensis]